MLSRIFPLAIAIGCLILITVSCSHSSVGKDDPINPSLTPQQATFVDNRYMWGFWTISVDPDTLEVTVTPLRSAQDHWNARKWLENGPCHDCVQVLNVTDAGDGTLLFDVELTHPFSNPNLTGFDVRGIPMFDYGYEYWLDTRIPTRESGRGELVNAEGSTYLYCLQTEGEGPGGLQGYSKGYYASTEMPDATINGYLRHISDDPANTRNAFYAGESVMRTYKIDMPDTFVFGYAVDASWAPPTVKPVTDPMEDFPPEANCYEPYMIWVSSSPIGQGLTDQGGWTRLVIDVYDHQGAGSYSAPRLYCDEVFDTPITAEYKKSYPDYASWEAIVPCSSHPDAGQYRCLIVVEDEMNATSPWFIDLTAYKVYTLEVDEFEQDPGWARTWGGDGDDGAYGVECDQYGNVYLAGSYSDTVDFNPGFYHDDHTSNGSTDAFVTKYNELGTYQWTQTFGGPGPDRALSVALGNDDGVFVVGSFSDTVDFDPGTGTEEEVSNGSQDAFLAKFDWLDGSLDWVRTWGGSQDDVARAVATDTFNPTDLFVVGSFRGTVKFHSTAPDSVSNGETDAFLVKYQANGGYGWRVTWGGENWDEANGVAMDEDEDVVVAGYFMNNDDASGVDFNPGYYEDVHVSWGASDAFLSKFDTNATYEWSVNWGGLDNDSANGVMMSGPMDYALIFVTGYYQGTIDFDPGPDQYFDGSQGGADVYLVRYDLDGTFVWGRSWGGTGTDVGYDVDAHDYPAPVVTGFFSGACDFDPGPTNVTGTSHGGTDVFYSNFSEDAEFSLARTWGGPEDDAGRAVGAPYWQRYYIAGSYAGSDVEFDPCDTVDLHSSEGGEDAFLSKFLWHGCW
jgi:hypothetical protein